MPWAWLTFQTVQVFLLLQDDSPQFASPPIKSAEKPHFPLKPLIFHNGNIILELVTGIKSSTNPLFPFVSLWRGDTNHRFTRRHAVKKHPSPTSEAREDGHRGIAW